MTAWRNHSAFGDAAAPHNLQRAPMQIHAEMIQIFEAGAFDIAHLELWLRAFAVAAK